MRPHRHPAHPNQHLRAQASFVRRQRRRQARPKIPQRWATLTYRALRALRLAFLAFAVHDIGAQCRLMGGSLATTSCADAWRERVLGKIEFKAAPTATNKERIEITNGFRSNIVRVKVPQLAGVPPLTSGKVYFHKKAVPQLLTMFAAWERRVRICF